MIGCVALKRPLLFSAFLFAILLAISLGMDGRKPLWKRLVGPAIGAAMAGLIAAGFERKRRRRE